VEILAQSSTAFVLTHNFQGTHIGRIAIAWHLVSGGHCKTFLFLKEERFRRSRSSKVTDIGANRKRLCDFLLVRNSNLGHIFHRFGDLTSFFVLLTPPLFNPNFWGVPVAPDRPCWASTSAWALSYLP